MWEGVVDNQVPDVVPKLRVFVDVGHGGLETGLEGVSLVLKQPQDTPPHQTRKPREGVKLGCRDQSLCHGNSSEAKSDSGQQIQANLERGSGCKGVRGVCVSV